MDTALSHFCMDRSNYQGYNCFSIYDAFAKKGRTSDKPESGCLVIFKHSHVGRVTGIRSGRIYTNEGNTSALYGDSNGGTVKNKDYYCANTVGDVWKKMEFTVKRRERHPLLYGRIS